MNLAERLEACTTAARDRLSRKRYMHVLGTCETSIALASAQDLDCGEAATAALLHDLAKETTPKELRADLQRRGRPIGPEYKEFPRLWHALGAAAWAEQDFGVTDPDTLEAIRLHPTGGGGMSPLAQVLFIADYTDPTRNWDGVEDLRRLARTDFAAALARAVQMKVANVRARGHVIHACALAALRDFGPTAEPLVKEGACD